jgi:hypothetical protein
MSKSLSKTKQEHKALLGRVHFEMKKCLKTYNLKLLFKYIKLDLSLRFSWNL